MGNCSACCDNYTLPPSKQNQKLKGPMATRSPKQYNGPSERPEEGDGLFLYEMAEDSTIVCMEI